MWLRPSCSTTSTRVLPPWLPLTVNSSGLTGPSSSVTPASKSRAKARLHHPLDLRDIGLLQFERRVGQSMRELTVVGQHDQPVGVGVEPTDVKQPLRSVTQQ